ncbi:EAL domain-containing protein [Aestuariibius insulae]|uniref:bifunctional diguanylate cyclase/phosphodiesterase n=1 Tax=Aestuariibius insulae TaxID=2058287 RepID=UPI00345E0935
MYHLIECLTQEHHYGLLAVAVLVCLSGSLLTAIVARKTIVSYGVRRRIQIFLAALIGGTAIWSTHFIAMLAYEPGYPHGYDATLTAVTLLISVSGLFISKMILGYASSPLNYGLGGITFGLTVVVMHYVGMVAYEVPGKLNWNPITVFASTALGCLFGVAAFHRFIHPVTRYCWMGGAVLIVLSICSMHFIGMTAFTIELSPLVEVPETLISDTTLGLLIFGVTSALFAIGFIGIRLEDGAVNDAQVKIEETATIDALTLLPNRLGLTKELSRCKALLEIDKTIKIAILTIDLDRFKEVNDLYGHADGDIVLSQVTSRISKALIQGEFIARSGGDEFVAIKRGFRRMEEVKAFAARLSSAFVEPIELLSASVLIGGSIGIATTVEDGKDIDGLLQKSDLAMYRAKDDPDRNIRFFDIEMGEINRERLSLIQDLRKALAKDEFELVYQLQNDVTSRAPSGFEVLLRWNHPDRGRVSPGEFIPLAEETGLIREIGLWVLRKACLEAASWQIPYTIAVNVAPQQLVQPSFLEHLSDVLMESRLDPALLELEVTEASIIDDQEYTLKVMSRIKDMGVRIAMDDFGTGYSSLATLQAFPFDKIKIDKSFIRDVHINKQRAAIVRATILLGDALDVPILAEGVEVEDELSFLNNECCKFVQGFLFGQPMSVQQVRELTDDLPENNSLMTG